MMNSIIDQVILTYGLETAPKVIDKIKAFGYKYATVSGTTWNIDANHDIRIEYREQTFEVSRTQRSKKTVDYLSLASEINVLNFVWPAHATPCATR